MSLRKIAHTQGDDIHIATAMFTRMTGAHPRGEVPKPFQFINCRELLRDTPHFKTAAHCGSFRIGSSPGVSGSVGKSATEWSTAQGSGSSSGSGSKG